jgi:hypothetical protein
VIIFFLLKCSSSKYFLIWKVLGYIFCMNFEISVSSLSSYNAKTLLVVRMGCTLASKTSSYSSWPTHNGILVSMKGLPRG